MRRLLTALACSLLLCAHATFVCGPAAGDVPAHATNAPSSNIARPRRPSDTLAYAAMLAPGNHMHVLYHDERRNEDLEERFRRLSPVIAADGAKSMYPVTPCLCVETANHFDCAARNFPACAQCSAIVK